MSADALLAHLECVRRTGPGRWLARCPAHPDRHPSLAIRELDDGRILVHDFAGCTVESVLSAVGLTFADLHPSRAIAHGCKRERRPFAAADVLRAIAFEATLVSIAAADLSRGSPLTEHDRARLWVAHARISAAMEETGHA
jgi:hypothetical protein